MIKIFVPNKSFNQFFLFLLPFLGVYWVMSSTLHRRQFSGLALLFQGIYIVLFGLFCRYDENALPFGSTNRIYVNTDYPCKCKKKLFDFLGFKL